VNLRRTQRTYRLFRTLALRFLCVVNHNNQVVGIISRTDLLPESLSESIAREGDAHMTHDGAHCL
jgi:chloride channel 7